MSLDIFSRDDIRNAIAAALQAMADSGADGEYWRGVVAMASALCRAFGIVSKEVQHGMADSRRGGAALRSGDVEPVRNVRQAG